MSTTATTRRPVVFAGFLILAGIIGVYASWELTMAKFQTLTDPGSSLGCDFSVLVQCGRNLESWQGSVFGFPNPILGLCGFVAPIAVGVGILAGARFARWFWILFNLGVVGALAFVCWLIYQSIFNLFTLCPWCMVVWSVTIPLFWAVTLYNLSRGHIPVTPGARRFFTAALGWVPLITIASYLVVAAIAQVRLDVISSLF
ncbi:putative membrane protein [Cryobacterium mesophilum]|uniref:Vitamin K epoxide reductase family protein n=1 Tax=Terrimesophilobacter mesophilus TaxID=433647 RepID=A0A4R8V9Y2_9MICO|nr:vitamin K epoxide reductase family protein [Terrimesophilobacter mesophilus]MBB5632314.1 putative membrane protein [Terrimesophilobacter mesophilus]TFB79156.1 vitamin K epoxide reductase family protein [Terrimesophilobacter mesophilus]